MKRKASGVLDDFPEGRSGKDDGDKGWRPPHRDPSWGALDSLEAYSVELTDSGRTTRFENASEMEQD